MSLNYKQAGVDIDAGNELVNRIKPFAKATKRIGAYSDLGGFGALFDLKKCNYKDPILVSLGKIASLSTAPTANPAKS